MGAYRDGTNDIEKKPHSINHRLTALDSNRPAPGTRDLEDL